MERVTHLTFSLLLFLLFGPFFQLALPLALFALFGSLLPDLDIKLGRLHRKLFHNLWFGFGFSWLLFALNPGFCFSFLIGFLSHLLADSLTPTGIWFFWPLGPRISGKIVTGSRGEAVLNLVFILLIALLLVRRF